MSSFYDKMYNVAKKQITAKGTVGTVSDLAGLARHDIRLVFLKPDRKREDMALERSYITNSNQRRVYFQLLSSTYEPERGCIITSAGKSYTIDSINPIAPANQLVVYECLVEV